MKNDPLFKFTVAVILAGVIADFAYPTPKPAVQPPASSKTIAAAPNPNPSASPATSQDRAPGHAVVKS